MREILFRGKRIDDDEWVYGYYVPFNNHHYILSGKLDITNGFPMFEKFEVISETISEYTGVNDKNDKKIFEGDILLMPKYGGGKHKTVVYFKSGKFAVDGSNYAFKDLSDKYKYYEVIGNIYDNPELLKE